MNNRIFAIKIFQGVNLKIYLEFKKKIYWSFLLKKSSFRIYSVRRESQVVSLL